MLFPKFMKWNIKSTNLEAIILQLAKEHSLDTICVTRGDKGALLYTQNKMFDHSGYSVEVKLGDVGALKYLH